MSVADDDRPRFEPPTADPPDYGVAGLPATPSPSAPGTAAPVPHRNSSATDPGLARQQVAVAPADPSNGMAVASLSLSVVGLGLLVISLGVLSPLALPCSILGWIFGHKAKQRPGEQGMAQGGLVSGIVGTVLGAVALVAWGALILAAESAWDASWSWG